MINNDTFFLGGFVLETGRPTLKSFEAERERVLPRFKSVALVNHSFVFGEHVSGFIVSHLEVTV